jgi:WD40 repeat protein
VTGCARQPAYFAQQLLLSASARGLRGLAHAALTRLTALGRPYLQPVWGTKAESMALQRTLKGHTHWVLAVALTGDGRAVSASWDHTLKVWDLTSGQELQTLCGHTAAVVAVALTGDGRAVSASFDGTLKVWNLARGLELTSLGASAGFVRVQVDPDGALLAGDAAGDLYCLRYVIHTSREKADVYKVPGMNARMSRLVYNLDCEIVQSSHDRRVTPWDENGSIISPSRPGERRGRALLVP